MVLKRTTNTSNRVNIVMLIGPQLVKKHLTITEHELHYHVHKIKSLAKILSQFNSVHTSITNFFKLQFNIILPSTSSSP
jgi:hypothetical protein